MSHLPENPDGGEFWVVSSTAGRCTTLVLRAGLTPEERVRAFHRLADILVPRPKLPESIRPLECVLRVVRDEGCNSVLIEHHYVDYDWQSEVQTTWALRQEPRANRVPRVHFFKGDLTEHPVFRLPLSVGYLGYMILRPVAAGPVGRTLVCVPSELDHQALCTVTETPSVFGTAFTVAGVPFVQQDGQFLRCAHAAIWQVQHQAAARGLTGQRTTAELAALPSDTAHRRHPSVGLTTEQTQQVFTKIGTPAIFYDAFALPKLPGRPSLAMYADDEPYNRPADRASLPAGRHREKLTRLCCRYVSSGFPPLVFSTRSGEHHAFVVVGWRYPDDGGAVELIVCDDQRGPYEIVTDPLHDEPRGTWQSIMVALPRPVSVTSEGAENWALTHVRASHRAVQQPASNQELTLVDEDLYALHDDLRSLGGAISIRTRLLPGRALKELVLGQQRSEEATELYRLADLSRWVWLVELQDRKLRDLGLPCVIADMVLDSTAHDDDCRTLLAATRRAAIDAQARPEPRVVTVADVGAWTSAIIPTAAIPDAAAKAA